MTPRSLLAPARLAGQPVLRTQSDARLVDLVRAGSAPAFEAIVTRYRRPLLRYCSRILPEERAEDVVQQAFVRAYDSMLGSDAELVLRPWLYRIAHNTALNALRDRGLRHEQLDERIDGVEQPDQALDRAQGLRAVVAAVQDLPERQRDAIVLRELEGRSYDEIAAQLGVTGGAVRQLLNRARNTLRTAATAVTPVGLVTRIPWAGGSESMGVRVAEMCGAAGTGAVVAKVCATALVTGAVVGGTAGLPKGDREAPASADEAVAATHDREAGAARRDQIFAGAPRGPGPSGDGDGHGGSGGSNDRSGPGGRDGGSERGEREADDRSGRREREDLVEDHDSSGPGSGEELQHLREGDSSGPGGGGDSSGPGSGDESDPEPDSSGPGSGGDSSGSGSGGDSSGSGSSGSGSSGSGSSGSGFSGSGSSGSGSSGSGSSGSR